MALRIMPTVIYSIEDYLVKGSLVIKFGKLQHLLAVSTGNFVFLLPVILHYSCQKTYISFHLIGFLLGQEVF